MDAAALLSMYSAGPDEMRTYAGAAIVQTDDRGSLEFSAPRAIVGSEDDNASVLRALTSSSRLPPAVASARIPADPGQWRDRGGMYLKAEAYALAYDALERAVAMDPDDQTGVDALVSAASGSGREDEAVAFLERTAPANSLRVAVRIGLSRLLASGGDPQSAVGQLAGLNEAYPDDPRALEQAAAILADAGDVEHLRPLADRLERRWPERASAAVLRGDSSPPRRAFRRCRAARTAGHPRPPEREQAPHGPRRVLRRASSIRSGPRGLRKSADACRAGSHFVYEPWALRAREGRAGVGHPPVCRSPRPRSIFSGGNPRAYAGAPANGSRGSSGASGAHGQRRRASVILPARSSPSDRRHRRRPSPTEPWR